MTKVKDVISWIVLVIMLFLFAVSVRSFYISKRIGEPSYIFGYRIIYVTSGSMEPTMKVNSAALSKRVDTIDDLEVGDIVSFTVTQDDGTVARATHRIYDIKDNVIYTKGDNNMVVDSYPITISDVESKVSIILNFTAWVADKWQSSIAGKIFLCSLALLFLLVLFTLSHLSKGGQKNEQS